MDDAIKNGRDKGLDGDLLVSVRIDHNALQKPRHIMESVGAFC
jgi:hypothetical protein